MNLDNLTKLAKLHCIFNSARTRAALIRNLYDWEGKPDNIATGVSDCAQRKYIWRDDCLLDSTICSPADAYHAALAKRPLSIAQLAD